MDTGWPRRVRFEIEDRTFRASDAQLPRALDRDAIRNELAAIPEALKAAKNDGQATGLAMKHLKQKGLSVLGDDVAAAVKELRGG